jgi:hypothetical protein
VHAHVQGLVSVVKMATVLEEEQRSVVLFCGQKGPNAKDINKK